MHSPILKIRAGHIAYIVLIVTGFAALPLAGCYERSDASSIDLIAEKIESCDPLATSDLRCPINQQELENFRSRFGVSLIHSLAANDRNCSIEFFRNSAHDIIRCGVAPNERDALGQTALVYLIRHPIGLRRPDPRFWILIDLGAKLDQHSASAIGAIKSLDKLLAHGPVFVNKMGENPAHYSLNADTVKCLVRHNVDLQKADVDGRTPVFNAVDSLNAEVVSAIMDSTDIPYSEKVKAIEQIEVLESRISSNAVELGIMEAEYNISASEIQRRLSIIRSMLADPEEGRDAEKKAAPPVEGDSQQGQG